MTENAAYAKYIRISWRATASGSCRIKLRTAAIGSLDWAPDQTFFARMLAPRNS